MNRSSASLPKSPLNTRSFLRRALARRSIALALPLLSLHQQAGAANTEYDVKNGSTDLTAPASYTTGGTPGTGAGGTTPATGPTVTSDVTFDSGTAYSPAAFTLNSSQIFGSLNDLSTTALTIANASGAGDTLTLGGSGDPGSSVPGAAAGDLLFLATGANLTISSGATGTATALGLVLGQSGNFDTVGTAALTINSFISDGGSGFGITKTGTGSLTLSGANTFSGGMSVQGGTVFAKNAAAFGTGPLSLGASSGTAGALVNYNGGSNLTVTNAINVNAGSSGLLEISATSGAPTLTGLITLANNLTLLNTNSAGANSLNVTGGIAGTGNVTFQATSAGGSVISGTALTFTGTLSNVSTGGAGFGVSANLSGAESVLQNSASSITTLSGTNTNTGTDTVAAGVLDFAKEVSLFNETTPGTLTATASNLIVQSGATAAFQVGGTGTFTAADIAALNALGTATGGFENGSRLGIDTTPGAFTYASPITDTNGGANVIGLTKLGTNTLTLTGTNTYTGPTFVTGGVLQIGAGGSLGSGTYAASILDSGTLEYSSTVTQTLSGSIGGGGALTKDTNTSTLTLSGVNTFTGATSVTAGTLDLANSLALQNSGTVSFTAPGAITFDSAVTSNAFVFGGVGTTANNSFVLQNTAGSAINLQIGNPLASANSTTSGVFSGTGSLTLAGFNNTITLTGANTYTGTTTVTGSTLNLGGAGANGSLASSALVLGGFGNGGAFTYTRTGTNTQSFGSTTINAGGNAITDTLATQTLSLGTLSSGAGGTVDINPNTTSVITTTSGNVNGIIGGFATFGGRTTWAVAPATAGGAITGLATYTSSATAGTAPANYAGQNIDVTASETLTGASTPNSVRFNTATAFTLTLTGLNTITSGGILQTAAATAGGTITGGTLTGSTAGQLSVTNGSGSATLNLNSLIVDNGATPTAVAASGLGSGGFIGFGNANNSFSGGLYFNGGRLGFAGGGTPFGTGTVTFGTQVFTGAGGGGINVGNSTITSGLLAAPQGANTSNGDISSGGGTAVWNLIGTGTASFAGIIGNYSGGRTVNLVLDSGTEIIANTQLGSSFLTANGGTFQVGNGYSGAYSNGANSVALNVGGGTFVEFGLLAGTTAQPFNTGLVVNPGASTVTAVNNSGAGTVVSFNGAGSRAAGGTVNFVLPSGTQSSINGFTTVNLNTNGILGGYATVGGTDWATNATNTSGGNIIGLSSSTINAYAVDSFAAGANTDVTTSDTPATFTTNSLRFNTGVAGGNTLTLNGANTITSGGILETANVGNNATTITGGTLTGSAQDLVVIQNNAANTLTISSVITGGGLTKSGAGELILAPAAFNPTANTFTGGVFMNGGILNTNSNGIASAGSFAFNGGTLQASSALSIAKAVTIGATGGTIDTNGNAVTIAGTVTGAIAGAGTLGGFASTGAFALTVADSTGGGVLTLSGTNPAFNGGIILNSGTVAAGSTAGLGTGYVTFGNSTTSTPTLDLGGFSPTIAGLIGATGTTGVVTNSGATNSVLTLDGVSTRTFAGTITDGATNIVGLTVALSNPTEAQILTGANTYSGATTVNAGALLVNGSRTPATPGSAVVTVNSGGTLGGTGILTVTSATVAVGGRLAPGATLGATTGSLRLNTAMGLTLNGTLAIGIAGTGGTSLATTGALTLGSGSILTVTGTANGTSDYDVANYGSLTAGSTFATANIPAGYVVNYTGSTFAPSDIELDPITPVPEPSALVWSGGLMLMAGLWQYRRRNRQASN